MPTRTRYSLRFNLMMVVAVCVVPVASICALLIYMQYQILKEQLDQATLLTACKLVADLDKELSSVESALKVLATSPDLAKGELDRFHKNAKLAVSSGIVYNYILTDTSGAQVLNTLLPYGSALPKTGTPPEIADVFTKRKTQLSGIFRGPVTGKYAIAMGVPVVINDQVRYSLNIGLAPLEIDRIIARQSLSDGWLIAVLDQYGTIVGRSRESAQYIGQKPVQAVYDATRRQPEGKLVSVTKEGIPAVTAFCSSAVWKWTVAIGAPISLLHDKIFSTIFLVSVATILALALGIFVARELSSRILNTVSDLNDAAAKLANGESIELPKTLLKEADAVGNAIMKVGNLMEEVRFMAQHDSLTGLANRRLFEELAMHQLDLAHRQQSQLAILAIDLDGFKQINDQMGHHVGDKVLELVGKRLSGAIRGSDFAARTGGDEFVVMLCDTKDEPVHEAANRVLLALAEPYPGVDMPLTGSIGLALFPVHGDKLDALMSAADQALYRAKALGKSRVEIAGKAISL